MSKIDISKDDEDYWNSSERHSFSFDQNYEADNLFGISKNGTAQLKAGISSIDLSDTYLSYDSTHESVAKPLLSIISEPTLMTILEADKIYLPKEETTIHPSTTLKKILLGQPFSLEKYKSLSHKTALLDAAIQSSNGNAILVIVLFITKTLKPTLVQRLLMDRPDAINVYIHYLYTRLKINEITDLLMMQARFLDAALVNLIAIINNTRDDNRLLQKLVKYFKIHFTNLSDCKEILFVKNFIKLLEWKVAVKSSGKYNGLPENNTVLEFLKYSCQNYWNIGENELLSPMLLSNQHSITPRQYQKVVLKTRVSIQAWDDIDRLLLSKGWLGSEKLQTNLPIEDILNILHQGQAPTFILDKFLKYVDNIKRRLQLAKSFGCARTVIQIFGTLGDRTALLEYKDTLTPQSESYFLAEKTLESPTIRWKS
ncbi:spermatogenesis-defective protein 39 homolog [Chelonus insularis]|uniref:spermatogenesis-defective protein 39 homolog n=1 Tax=Chelonus insularis TaxID=460826 RepID=UPI00158EBB98|nr:spermatogenesis-defective protein 39 homolog [Chelonus insularis]